MDLQSFRHAVLTSRLYDHDVLESYSADAYTELFEAEISRVLDICAPLRTGTQRRGKHDRSFQSDEARTAKRTCRRLERHFRRTGAPSDKQTFVQARSIARDLINKSRADALTAKVNESAGDSKKMWNTTRKLLHSKPVTNMSDDECASMSRAFSQFFIDKVARIQHAIAEFIKTVSCPAQMLRPFVGSPLSVFTSVSSAEVVKLIRTMPNKLSPRDVLPTSLLKSCMDEFAPVIAHLTNRSFTDGVFPHLFKTAQVLPLLKKPGLDRDNPANYRPISNLSTISKIVERLVLVRLRPHLLASGNFNPLQSAYRSGHSTETALLRMMDSFYKAADDKG